MSTFLPLVPQSIGHQEDLNQPIYSRHFQLDEPPFRITPDPDFFFYTPHHARAIEKLLYGIRSGAGFMWVLGEVGTGKTTLCRYLLKTLHNQAHVAYIVNPNLSPVDLLTSILDDLGLHHATVSSKKDLMDTFRDFLIHQSNKRTIVIIDDAQALPDETIEDLRLLSNLETDKEKLVQLILLGQPELEAKLSKPHLRQLHQRITIRCDLPPLDRNEVGDYIRWRLQKAGNRGQVRFTKSAVSKLASRTGGIPRLVNILAEYALVAAYVEGTRTIEARHVVRAACDLRLKNPSTSLSRSLPWVCLALASALLAGVTVFMTMIR